MTVQTVADALLPHGLSTPDLAFLRPDEHRYTALLMQPSGPILGDAHYVGPFDRDAASAKARTFLELARERGASLAVAPEYFVPWSALKDAIASGVTPAHEALWVLGCASATQLELQQFQHDLAEHCLVVHEPWTQLDPDRDLLDCAVLLFQARNQDQSRRLVALIQFKTCPSRDETFLEEQLLRRGTTIYKFTGTSGHLSAATIICSDAFSIGPVLSQLNFNSTLIHIQLNPKPTHADYRSYRATTFRSDAKMTNCHIVCLNWAHWIQEYHNARDQPKAWKNISASTWYCPEDECSCKDPNVLPNHQLGLYYTYMKERRHALRFDSEEAVFELLVPKLLRGDAPAAIVNRHGPSMLRRYVWDPPSSQWVTAPLPAVDGSAAFFDEHVEARTALEHVLAANDPLSIERVLALSAAGITGQSNWFELRHIDSCTIQEDEVVQRMSVIQDDLGHIFRHRRILAVREIKHELGRLERWPKQVSGLNPGATIEWSIEDPNFNVRSAGGAPTLIAFLDDSHSENVIATKTDMLYELLRKAGGDHQKRLCVMHREHGQLKFAQIEALTRIDEPDAPMTEFTAVHPLDSFGEER